MSRNAQSHPKHQSHQRHQSHPNSVARSVVTAPNPALEAALWVALLLAFSPALFDLVQHLRETPSARYVIATPLLILLAHCYSHARSAPTRSTPKRYGYLFAALGLAAAMFFMLAEPLPFARLGFPVAVIGLARALGRPQLSVAMISIWCIPLPSLVLETLGKTLLHFELDLALFATGSNLQATDLEDFGLRVMDASGAALDLDFAASGLPLVYWLLGLTAYAKIALPPRQPLRNVFEHGAPFLVAALVALATQTLLLIALLARFPQWSPSTAAFALHSAPWVFFTLSTLFIVEYLRRDAPGDATQHSGANHAAPESPAS